MSDKISDERLDELIAKTRNRRSRGGYDTKECLKELRTLRARLAEAEAERDGALLQSDAYLRRLNIVGDESEKFADALIAIKETSKCACQAGGEWCDGIDIASRAIDAANAARVSKQAQEDKT